MEDVQPSALQIDHQRDQQLQAHAQHIGVVVAQRIPAHGEKMEEGAQKVAKYKEDVRNVAKSYTMYMDTQNGNNADGLVTLEEYTNFEKTNPENKKIDDATLSANAKTLFTTMDLNNDGKLDWLEVGAALKSYDTNGDGILTKDEVEKGSQNIFTNPYEARYQFNKAYNELEP